MHLVQKFLVFPGGHWVNQIFDQHSSNLIFHFFFVDSIFIYIDHNSGDTLWEIEKLFLTLEIKFNLLSVYLLFLTLHLLRKHQDNRLRS